MDKITEAYQRTIKEGQIVFDPAKDGDLTDVQMEAMGYLQNNLDALLKQQKVFVKQMEAALKKAGWNPKEVRSELEDSLSSDRRSPDIDTVWPN